jgi:hypothetical protein
MGIMSIVKNVIEHFRKAGKTENEISGMIEQAADRATVNKGVAEKRNIKDRKSRSKHRQNSSSRQSCKRVSQRSR